MQQSTPAINKQDQRAKIRIYMSIFTGQPIDGPCNGPAPGPWDIQAQPPQMFQNQKTEIEVPHTASVKVEINSILILPFSPNQSGYQ